MSHLTNVIKKELRELVTPSSMVPVIAVMFLFIAMGSMMGGEISEQTSVQPIGYINLCDGGAYAQDSIQALDDYYVSTYKVDPAEYVKDITAGVDVSNPDTIYDAMIKNNVSTALVIPEDFDQKIENWESAFAIIDIYYAQESTGVFSSLSTVYGSQAVVVINDRMTSVLLLENTDLSESQIQKIKATCSFTNSTFLKGDLHEGVTPDQIYSAISGQTTFIPLIIMIVIVMIGSIVISSIGNEKENKTLETLLTMPIKRTTIVTGKLIGASIAGLIMCAFYMVGMFFYVNGLSISTAGGVSIDSLGLTLSMLDWVIVALSMFVTILCALGLCMLLGAFAKNYKTAQMMVAPISILAVIPMLVTMFSNFSDLPFVIQGLLFIIPFTHPMMIVQNIMFNNTAMVYGGLIYVAIFAVVVILLTAKIYNSDILLTGIKRRKARAE